MTRFVSDLVGRATGPMMFRFILQPLMATFLAYRDGLQDARSGRPPYLYTIITEPGERKELLTHGFRAVSRVIVLGVVMDMAYQMFVLGGRFRPLELVVIVLLLAFVPYLVFRGPFNRLARRRTHA